MKRKDKHLIGLSGYSVMRLCKEIKIFKMVLVSHPTARNGGDPQVIVAINSHPVWHLILQSSHLEIEQNALATCRDECICCVEVMTH